MYKICDYHHQSESEPDSDKHKSSFNKCVEIFVEDVDDDVPLLWWPFVLLKLLTTVLSGSESESLSLDDEEESEISPTPISISERGNIDGDLSVGFKAVVEVGGGWELWGGSKSSTPIIGKLAKVLWLCDLETIANRHGAPRYRSTNTYSFVCASRFGLLLWWLGEG